MSDRKGEWGGKALGRGLLPAIAAVAGSGLGAVWVEWVLVGLR